MELIGTIEKIFEIQSVTDTFSKRNMVLTTNDMYPQKILIEFVQEKTTLLDNFNQGDNVKVGINIRGREWTNPEGEVKYFNSIIGWRIEAYASDHHQSTIKNQHSNEKVQYQSTGSNSNANDDDIDDLPF